MSTEALPMSLLKKYFVYFILLALGFMGCKEPYPFVLTPDVLVVGGGASGTAAAIQAARQGAQVLLIEETPWLGGMLTAAGVGATDGNHKLPSGIWGEFRQHLYDYYGGPEAVETGWVSNTLFEPKVGNQIWNQMADKETNLKRFHGYRLIKLERKEGRIDQVFFVNESGEQIQVHAKINIDATELGDLLALAGVNFVTGNDSPAQPHDPNIQDLTYTAVLKDFGEGMDKTIPKPEGYDPTEFDCICKEVCDDPTRKVPDCETFLNYGRLPNNKFMINWPNNGNDYFLNPIPMTFEERIEAYKPAKARTLDLLYFLQTEAGYTNLGLADDEYTTEDLLPFIPYHREARRIVGKIQLKVADLEDPYANSERPFYRQAIAVGDYPLDHHHDKNPEAQAFEFPAIPSFSIPYQALVPLEVENLLVAEKSISVSHRANGSTRLQPCVILIGQAAGMAAAMCVDQKTSPEKLNIATLQQNLLDAKCWLMPFIDIDPSDWYFQAAQKAGITGKIRGHGVPYKWANQTWFYPDSAMTRAEFLAIKPKVRLDMPEPDANQVLMTRGMILDMLGLMFENAELDYQSNLYEDLSSEENAMLPWLKKEGYLDHWAEGKKFYPNQAITRKEAVWLVNEIWPFLE